MTYKQIEASREARLWIGQVLIPVATCAAIVMTNSNIRSTLKTKAVKLLDKVKAKLEK